MALKRLEKAMSSLTNNLKRGSTEKNKRKNISWDEGVKDHPNRRTKETTELTYEDGGFPDIVATEITVDSDSIGGGEEADNKVETRVFRPGKDQLKEDEVLDFDPSAYKLYHSMTAQWPCLSFDILRDRLGVGRKRFPVTCYMVAGTQADDPSKNEIILMKLSDLHKVQSGNSDSEDSDDDDDNLDDDPILVSKTIPHVGGVNRIRSMPQKPEIVSTWSDNGTVYMYDVGLQMKALDGPLPPGSKAPSETPFFSFDGHTQEGFAMDWSPAHTGRFVTGDCDRFIHLYEPNQDGSWNVRASNPFTGHTASVEDLQWSPSEPTVFASGSCDRSIRIWDIRQREKSQLTLAEAHETDVNVLSWSSVVGFLLASGADDGSFKVWDLRNFKADSPVAHFKYHMAPITSIEWSPTEDSVVAVAGADNQISVWDMSLEEDREEAEKVASGAIEGIDDIPPQLLFVHQGQNDIKELHFHPQVPGLVVSTALDGFNIWRSCNL